METGERWLTSKFASAYLSVNLRTLYRLIDDGELPAYRIGRVIRLKEVDLVAYVESARILPGTLEHLHPTPVRPRVA